MDLIIAKQSPNLIFIDAIKSHLSPGKEWLLELLDRFENGEYDTYDLVDLSEERNREMEEEYREYLNLPKDCQVRINYYDDHNLDLTKYRNTFDWMVFDLFWDASPLDEPLMLEDVPFIREFLNTPSGKEEGVYERWQEYWNEVDFEVRRSYLERHVYLWVPKSDKDYLQPDLWERLLEEYPHEAHKRFYNHLSIDQNFEKLKEDIHHIPRHVLRKLIEKIQVQDGTIQKRAQKLLELQERCDQ